MPDSFSVSRGHVQKVTVNQRSIFVPDVKIDVDLIRSEDKVSVVRFRRKTGRGGKSEFRQIRDGKRLTINSNNLRFV